MKKLLSTLLTIIFFQTSIFAFPLSFIAFNNYNSNSLKVIKEIPNNIKETYTATANVSNVENLQSLGYSIGDRAYDYKENPMLLAKDATSLFTSYDMYEAGFNNDNMFYGSALVLGGLALDIAGAPIKAGKTVVKTAKATEKIAKKTEQLTKKVDFYVKSTGEVIPATGYRYISKNSGYLDMLRKNMEIPINNKGTYLSFNKYDFPAKNFLQTPHDASIRLEFNTLQIIDDIRIPYGKWGTQNYLEPLTKDYLEYGVGGATQAITNKPIKLDVIKDLSNTK